MVNQLRWMNYFPIQNKDIKKALFISPGMSLDYTGDQIIDLFNNFFQK